MSANNLCDRVEQALVGYVSATLPTVDVFRSKQAEPGDGLTADRVEVTSTGSSPGIPGLHASSGYAGRWVAIRMRIRTRADVLRDDNRTQIGDGNDRHAAILGAVVDALQVTDIAGELAAIGIEGIGFDGVRPWTESAGNDSSGYFTDLNFEVLAYSVAT